MTVKTSFNRKAQQVSTGQVSRRITALSVAAATIFVFSLATPVTVNFDAGIAFNNAQAGNGNGNGGGNGGGNGKGNGGGNGKGNGGGNGNGNAGGNGNGKGNGQSPVNGVDVASVDPDNDRLVLLTPPVEEITMALFTTRISKRYPADEVTSLDSPHQAVSFFSELKEMSGKEISHVWYYDNEVKFKASFKIRARSWRVWSTQLLPEDMPGEWKVEIVDENGKVLKIRKMDYAPQGIELLAQQ